MKFFNLIVGIALIVFRIFIIYEVCSGIYFYQQNPNLHPIGDITIYIYIMICDYYVMNIFKAEKDEE